MTNFFDDTSRSDDYIDERARAHEIASRFLDAYPVVYRASTALTLHEIALLARVVRRHCGEAATRIPMIVASPSDRTLPNGHVIGSVDRDISDGVCLAAGVQSELETTRAPAPRTRMFRCADGSAYVVKGGGRS